MTARVGDTVCATDSNPVVPTDGQNRLLFTLRVPSAEVVPSCGTEGAQVTFFVGDQQAVETAAWHAGAQQFMFFVAGNPFARFDGSLSKQPFPGSQLCLLLGRHYAVLATGFGWTRGRRSPPQSAPWLRDAGAAGHLQILDARGNVFAVAIETGTWHAWDGITSRRRST